MTQFLKFEKLTTGTTSKHSSLLVNRETLLLVEPVTLEDKELGTTFVASRVVIIGYPEYTFYTLTSLATLQATLDAVDGTGAITVGGSSCSLDPGVLDIVSVSTQLPLLKLLRVNNNISTLTTPYVCNPNYLLYAEEVPFLDEDTELQVTGLMLTFRGNPLRRVPTKLTFAELCTLLEPLTL